MFQKTKIYLFDPIASTRPLQLPSGNIGRSDLTCYYYNVVEIKTFSNLLSDWDSILDAISLISIISIR